MLTTGQTYDIDIIRRFLSYFYTPGYGFEIRILSGKIDGRSGYITRPDDYPRRFGGYFDDIDIAASELKRLKNVSGYIVVNPVFSELLARDNYRRLLPMAKGDGTLDTQIARIDRFLLDIDAIRIDKKISATDAEHRKALAVRDRILAEIPGLAAASIYGSSGNGGWIAVHVGGLDNTEANRKLIERFIKAVGQLYTGPDGEVDTSTFNVSQLMPVAGTKKCKGNNLKERPWRMVTIENPEGFVPVPFDLAAWVAEHAPDDAPRPARDDKAPITAAVFDDRLRKRVYAYVNQFAAAIEGEHGSDQTFDVACSLIKGFNLSMSHAWEVIQHYNQRCIPPWPDDQLWHKLESADSKPDNRPRGYLLDAESRSSKPTPPPPANAEQFRFSDDPVKNGLIDAGPIANPDDHHAPDDIHDGALEHPVRPGALPTIVCNDTSLIKVKGLTLAAMAIANEPPVLYSQGGRLARVRKSEDGRWASIELMDPHMLRDRIGKAAKFVNEKETKHGVSRVEIYPPMDVVFAILASDQISRSAAPPIQQVISTPRFVGDGEMVIRPGYHEKSGLYYHPIPGIDFGAIPEQPTDDDVRWARSFLIDEYIPDFPFDSDASRANTIGCMLLPFVRPMIEGPTPIHFFGASTEGTGKSKLANACAFPSLGTPMDLQTKKEDEAEWRKSITTTLLQGSTHFFIDNIDNLNYRGESSTVESGVLAAATLGDGMWADRLMHTQKSIKMEMKIIWMFTGNNVEWSKELQRRIVSIRLKTPQENPSQRKNWRCDPLTFEGWQSAHHAELVRACLILCQHWIAKGRPKGGVVFGSYDHYARIIGGILECAGIDGFLQNLGEERVLSHETNRWPDLVELWAQKHGEATVSTTDLYHLIYGEELGQTGMFFGGDEDLKVQFNEILGNGKILSQKQRLGHALTKQHDRVYGSYRILKDGDTHHRRKCGSSYRLQAIVGSPVATQPEGETPAAPKPPGDSQGLLPPFADPSEI